MGSSGAVQETLCEHVLDLTMAFFWKAAPSCLKERYRRFGGICYLGVHYNLFRNPNSLGIQMLSCGQFSGTPVA
jgi:hypothetical protein